MQSKQFLSRLSNLGHIHLLLKEEVVVLAVNATKPGIKAIIDLSPLQHPYIRGQAAIHSHQVVLIFELFYVETHNVAKS